MVKFINKQLSKRNDRKILWGKLSMVFLPILILWTTITHSQSLSPFVVSSSGGFYSGASGTLSFTTGEMASIETFTSAGNILTQGFQQAWDFNTYTAEHSDRNFSFGIYPNPSDGNFNLVIETKGDEHIAVRILDVLGREILQWEFYQQNKITIEPFKLSTSADGIYLIEITIQDNISGSEKYFSQKIQVIK